MINKILSFVLYKKLTKAIKIGVFRQEKSEALSDTKAAVAVVRHMKAVINKDPKAHKCKLAKKICKRIYSNAKCI